MSRLNASLKNLQIPTTNLIMKFKPTPASKLKETMPPEFVKANRTLKLINTKMRYILQTVVGPFLLYLEFRAKGPLPRNNQN